MISSIDDFKIHLLEVEILISYARSNKHSLDKYKLFNKLSIVMLCTHFETFVESFVEEHVDVLKNCYQSSNLPQYMKDNYINDTVKTLKILSNPLQKQKSLKALFLLHDSVSTDMRKIKDLELNMKYSYGKHGQKDTERIFKKFGFENFVNTDSFQEAFKKINSAISIRNNIIHEGSAPTLSHADVILYKQEFIKFADELEKHILANQNTYYGKIYYT